MKAALEFFQSDTTCFSSVEFQLSTRNGAELHKKRPPASAAWRFNFPLETSEILLSSAKLELHAAKAGYLSEELVGSSAKLKPHLLKQVCDAQCRS